MSGRLATVLRSQRGLTLLELIIAMTILGLIFVILGAALRISYNAIERGEKHMERIHRARVITELIAQELRSTYRFTPFGAAKKVITFKGEPDRFSFVTTAPLRTRGLRHSGLKEVTLTVEADATTGRRGLVLREDIIPHGTLFEEDKGFRMMLDPTVAALRCRYFGTPGAKTKPPRPARWEERWESDRPPKAVEVLLEFQPPEDGNGMEELPPLTLVVPIEQTVEVKNE
ncbi:MAG: type II secretion system protein J [Candidatus Tectimicrobiota bacterium]